MRRLPPPFLLVLSLSLLLFLLSLPPASSQSALSAAKALIFSRLFAVYDPDTRPYFNQSLNGASIPVSVTTQFRINLLYAVSSRDEQFNVDLFVSEQWLDPRLAFPPAMWDTANYGALRVPVSRPWKPDTFFYNALSCTTSDQLLTLVASGTLTWTRHLTCTIHDSFALQQFPFDSQTLPLLRLSFAYNMNELMLYAASPCFSPDPALNFENSLWDLGQAADCQQGYLSFRSSQAPYSEVTANLYVVRKYTNYVVKLILPMFIIVLLSTLTYWIDPMSAPARVGGTVTLVLSIVTFNLTVSNDLPKINYNTLLDWFVWYCFIFVIFAVAEFATVHHILYSKAFPAKLAWLIDDFCAYTLAVVWCLSNLLAWPPLLGGSQALYGLVLFIDVSYLLLNVYRFYWNWKEDKKGVALYRHWFHTLKQRYWSKGDDKKDEDGQKEADKK